MYQQQKKSDSSKTTYWARLGVSLMLAVLFLAGCGSSSGDFVTNNPQPLPTGNPTDPTPPTHPTPTENLNQVLSGRYGLISATVSGLGSAVSIGEVVANGQGGFTSGSLDIATFVRSTNQIVLTNATLAGGNYNVSKDRRLTGSISDSNGVWARITSGGVTSSSSFAGGNWLNSQNSAGQFVLLKGLSNPSNQSLNGQYRFVVSEVGNFGGYASGNLTLNGSGQITGGAIERSGGTNDTITGGTYSVNANSTFSMTLEFQSGVSANAKGFAGRDGTLAFSVQDNLGDIGLGIANPGVSGTASNADLKGDLFYLGLRTAPLSGIGYATGSLTSNGIGNFTSGAVNYESGSQYSATGNYNLSSNGTGTLSAILSNGATVNSSFFLHADRQAASGFASDNFGNQGILVLVK